jgi:dynein heavy chain
MWLKKLYKKQNLNTYKGDAKDDALKKQMEKIGLNIRQGHPVLMENICETIDSTFSNLISKALFESGSGYNIEFNGQSIEYDPKFRIFFTTKLSNPHFSPEIYLKLNIINFTVTFEGLGEQLLGEVFKKERREKYEERDHLIEEMGQNNAKLQEFARIILQKLADANEEAILDDEVLIETLENAKSSSDIVKVKTTENLIIEKEINGIRDAYIPVATRGSILYFVIVDLGIIDPMYQFSLEYFKKVFSQSIQRAPTSDDVKERVIILEKKITEDIYKNIKRGIFESHKTIFSFLIAIYIQKVKDEIKDEEWNIFLKGPSAFDKSDMLENPDKNYFSDFCWETLLYLEKKNNLQNISRFITDNLSSYKQFFDNTTEYHEFESMPNIEFLKPSLKTNFSLLNLIKVFRPDKVLYFIKKFISSEIGEFFIDTSPPKIDELYAESDNKTPIIFILSQGADPTNTLIEFNSKYVLGFTEEGKPIIPEMEIISLGQGQGDKAKDAIAEGRNKGKWVVLANCHLYTTWMQELSNLVQSIQEDDGEIETNENFRLWLTSMPNKDFPVSILQNSLKLTTEPPSGVKGNIRKLFDDLNDEKLNMCTKINIFPKIIFSLAVFHAVIQERKKFGPIGFNIRYDFNAADFETSMKLISVYLDEAEEDNIPWPHIIYLIGEINYGGRVTDDFDRETMNKSLEKFLNEEKLFEPDFKFSKSGIYYPVGFDKIEKFNEYIDSLPIFDEPDLFGLNENANIIYQIQESEKIINSLIAVMPKTKTKETSPNKIVLESIDNFVMQKPELIHKRVTIIKI